MFLLEPGSDAVQTKKLLCVLVQHAQQSERLCGERKASKKLNQDQMQGSIDGPSPSDCMQRWCSGNACTNAFKYDFDTDQAA